MSSFLLNVWLTYTWICASYSADYYVAHGGHDLPNCGNSSFPCGSVKYAVNISHSGDTIYIDHANGRPYQECEGHGTPAINITNSLSFIGIHGTAAIECYKKSNILFNVQENNKIDQTVSFINLNLTAAAHAISSEHSFTKILISRCFFSGNKIGVMLKRLAQCDIAVYNSLFLSNINAAVKITSCGNVSVNFTNATFYRSAVSVTNTKASKIRVFQVYIADSSFYGRVPLSDVDMQCPLLVVNCQRADAFKITIVSSKFENFHGVPRTHYDAVIVLYDNRTAHEQHSTTILLNNVTVRNIRPTRCKIKALFVRPSWKKGSQFNVTVNNSRFCNSIRALSIYPRTSIGKRTNTHAKFFIENTTFVDNYGPTVGYGAACSFGKGHYYITSCQFINNHSIDKFYMGTIVLYSSARATFSSCNFEYHRANGNPLQIYSTADSGLLFEGLNTFDITNINRSHSIIVHTASYARSNGASVQNHGKINIICPRGYRIRDTTVLAKMNSTFSYFVYSCRKACGPEYYSIVRGKLVANKRYVPKCQRCPPGGKCVGGQLTSQPNFWGYKSGTNITFVNCPFGYCCEKEPCESYNGCNGNRTGTLCGTCPQNTSELLFETKCVRNEECEGRGFWIGIFILVLSYCLLFLFYSDVVKFIMAFVFPPNQISVAEGNESIGNEYSSWQTKSRVGDGLLKIFFYYYQVVHIFSSNAPQNRDAARSIRLAISRTFNFLVSKVFYTDCPFPNLRPIQNAVILHSLGFLLLGFISLLFIAWKIWTCLKNCLNNSTSENMASVFQRVEMEHAPNPRGTRNRPFECRIATAFTHISLLMYSSSAQLCLSLLRCVPVEGRKILFIDGNLRCYQTFQYFALVHVVINIIPFCLVPVLGSYLLASNSISVTQFCLACVFPLPFSVYWAILLWKSYRKSTLLGYIPAAEPQFEPLLGDEPIMNKAVTPRSAILKVLVGPFRTYPSVCIQRARIPWEGFLIFRRLVMILLFTFIYNVNVRMLLVHLTCVVILVTHLCVRPFKRPLENALETISLITLTILSGFTHLQVIYNGVQMKMKSHTVDVIHINIVQNILILAPVSLMVFLITIAVLYQFGKRLFRMVVLFSHKFR